MSSFLDTNVLIYAFADDDRSEPARGLLEAGGHVAIQSLNEFAAVARGKMRMSWPSVRTAIALIESFCEVAAPLDLRLQRVGLDLAEDHEVPIFDAMLLAVALESGCSAFYSEDLQHGRVVDGRLTIVNPFV